MTSAERTTWQIYAGVVADTLGFLSPLHMVAMEAGAGSDKAADRISSGQEFWKLQPEQIIRLEAALAAARVNPIRTVLQHQGPMP